ncbi:MAG: hypothetical protein MJE77_18450 [Proteobacteria bacterium]|nr:hypothetical protein [Pseudomonadota bacterium]
MAIFFLLWSGCIVRAPASNPGSAIEVRYRLRTLRVGNGSGVVTATYRNILARSLFSRCQMVPSDSQMFDLRVKRCGTLRTVVGSIARLFLERAATGRYLRPVRFEGRLRWLDFPDAVSCD